MAEKVSSIDHRLLIPRCLCCGYDGALLDGGLAEHCARCGCDLRERPARSYAEMEGFVEPAFELHGPIDETLPSPPRRTHRWLAFLAMMTIGAVTVLYLVAAALPS
ncbi:MAG: hypothetical protein GY715_19970 [Planctomycetes bacterium]|nr:hypothetical protein [Planctomycetota bacterium]